MFDPFGDFETRGYLRNASGEKDPDIIRAAEHALFRAQLPTALTYLAKAKALEYEHFLGVHKILFEGLYEWAGQDRAAIAPMSAISKGPVHFARPEECQRAVKYGLHLGQQEGNMRARPGHVMGLFAFGHPFLEGNGRVMLLVHAELCFRQGLSINWLGTTKGGYLEALSREIADPHGNHLDGYLRAHIAEPLPRNRWLQVAHDLRGLEGKPDETDIAQVYSDPGVEAEQEAFERQRGYDLSKLAV